MTLSILNGVLSFASALLPNILDSILRIPLFLLLMMSPILSTMISPPLNILFAILTGSFYLAKASLRRQDCLGRTNLIDVTNTRAYYLSLRNPLHQALFRYILTGSVDHASRLYKSRLLSSPLCLYCNNCEETAKHIFWDCTRWTFIRKKYPLLLRLFSIVGSQWPPCFLHCGWIECHCDYGIPLLHNLNLAYTFSDFVNNTHHMFLEILLARHAASQVLRSTPQTPPHHPTSPSTPHTINSSPSSVVQLPEDVSPILCLYSPG